MIDLMAIVMASIIWSLHPALIFRFKNYVKPITYTAIRAIAAMVFLLLIVPFSEVRLSGLKPSTMVIVIVSAILGPGIGDASYAKAIQLIGSSLAVVISYTYIFIAQSIAVVFLGETLSAFTVTGTILAFTGVVIATFRGPTNSFKLHGIGYAVATSVSWGIATSMIKIALKQVDAFALTIVRIAIIALFFLPLGLAIEGVPRRDSAKAIFILAIVTGVLGWGIGMYLFIYSISAIGVSITAIATALTPVLAQITTKLFTKEHLSKNNIIGALMISVGIVVSAVRLY